jgi:hypothetical protein
MDTDNPVSVRPDHHRNVRFRVHCQEALMSLLTDILHKLVHFDDGEIHDLINKLDTPVETDSQETTSAAE